MTAIIVGRDPPYLSHLAIIIIIKESESHLLFLNKDYGSGLFVLYNRMTQMRFYL